MTLAKDERAALSDTFADVGGDVPTLCGDWDSRDLLCHLLARERKPWAAPGILIPGLEAIAQRAMAGYEDEAWPELVEMFRTGPPPWAITAIGPVDALLNGAEHFVHHEDVRRGSPGWTVRPSDDRRNGELWTVLRRMARLLYRKSPVGVVLRGLDGTTITPKQGSSSVTLIGEPGELVLYSYGRSEVVLDFEGAEDDIAALDGSDRSL